MAKIIKKANEFSFLFTLMIMLCGMIPLLPKIVTNGLSIGDPCSDADACDQESFLNCDQGTGTCLCPVTFAGSTYFDLLDQQCHLFVSEYCGETEMSCPINGKCDTNANLICACNATSGYEVTKTKKCAKAYNASCTDPRDCNRDTFFQCTGEITKRCQCDPLTSTLIYRDQGDPECVLKLGQSCNLEALPDQLIQKCGQGAQCRDRGLGNQCECSDGTIENSSGECRAQIDEPCDNERPCDASKFFYCDLVDQVCHCTSPLTSHYDLADGQCYLNIGEVCACAKKETPSADLFMDCAFNGFCGYDGERCACVCASGFNSTATNKCARQVGDACSTDSECDRDKSVKCIGSQNEAKTCDCDYSTSDFDFEREECVLKLGQSCSLISGGAGTVIQNCGQWASCEGSNLQCECDAGLIANGHGQCRVGLDGFCSANGAPCDEQSMLSCENNQDGAGFKCYCASGYHDDGMGNCRLNLDQKCQPNGPFLCGQSAHCSQLDHICVCDQQFEPNESGTGCILSQLFCPENFDCDLTHEFCNVSVGICQQKKKIGEPCLDQLSCGNFTNCSETTKLCECILQHVPDGTNGQNVNCKLATRCPFDFQCPIDQFCDLLLGVCELRKGLGSPCDFSSECGGVNTICGGVKTCQCMSKFFPDRPLDDPEVTCVAREGEQLVECRATDMYGTGWSAFLGEIKFMPCPRGQIGSAAWKCGDDGRFFGDQPNYGNCSTPWVGQLEGQLEVIKINGTIQFDDASSFMEQFEGRLEMALVAEFSAGNLENEFFGHETQKMVDFIHTIVTSVDNASTISRKIAKDGGELVQKYEQLFQKIYLTTGMLLRFKKPWEQLEIDARTTTFTNTLNVISTTGFELIDRVTSMNEDEYKKTFTESTFTVGGVRSLYPPLQFPFDSEKRQGLESFIELPDEMIDSLERGDSSRQTFIGSDLKLDFIKQFIPGTVLNMEDLTVDSKKTLNSNLMGLTLTKREDEGEPDVFTNASEIVITFLHDADAWGSTHKKIYRTLHPGEKPRAVKGTTTCVQWDEEKKIWSTEGCRLVETETFYTICACDRPSSYAIANEFHEYPGKTTEQYIINFIMYFGTIGYQLYKIVESWFSAKKEKKDDRQKEVEKSVEKSVEKDKQIESGNVTTLNNVTTDVRRYMNIFMALSNIFLLFFVDRHFINLSESWCAFVGFLSHLTILCSFMFLFILALHLHFHHPLSPDDDIVNKKSGKKSSIKSVLKCVQNYEKWTYPLLCLGVPFFIVGVTALCGLTGGHNARVYGGDFCWLDGPFIWSFFVPVFFIIILNLILMSFLIWKVGRGLNKSLAKGEKEPKTEDDGPVDEKSIEASRSDYEDQLGRHRVTALQNMSLSILLGLTWILGYFYIGPNYDDSTFVTLAFPILIGLQAILTYVMKEEEMQKVVNFFDKNKTKKKDQQGQTKGEGHTLYCCSYNVFCCGHGDQETKEGQTDRMRLTLNLDTTLDDTMI